MRFRFAALFLLAAFPSLAHARELFALDRAQSSLQFSMPLSGSQSVRARFGSISGHIYLDEQNPRRSLFSFVIRADSVSDERLKAKEFFDAKKSPEIIFDSSFVRLTPKGYIARGILWVKGTTRHVLVPFDMVEKPAVDASGNRRFAIAGHFTTTRTTLGLAGSKSDGDSIDVDFKFTFQRWKPSAGRLSREGRHIQRAVELLAQNNTAAATKEVQQALDVAPRSSAARVLGIVLGLPLH